MSLIIDVHVIAAGDAEVCGIEKHNYARTQLKIVPLHYVETDMKASNYSDVVLMERVGGLLVVVCVRVKHLHRRVRTL